MAKEVKEEKLALVIHLTREGGTGSVKVSCRTDYVVSSDDLVVTRSLDMALSQEQENAIKSFGAQALQQVKQLEED